MPADQSLIDAAVELAAKLQREAVALQTVSERPQQAPRLANMPPPARILMRGRHR